MPRGNHYTICIGYAGFNRYMRILYNCFTALRVDIWFLEVVILSPTTELCVLMTPSCIVPTQDAVHLGHHISVVTKGRLGADATAKYWRGHNMFMADFGHVKTNVKCNL